MAAKRIDLYDTTLRDGAQQEGISFTVSDKLKITQKLDELGINYIEGGWPGSNPKDTEFFEKAKNLKLKNAVLVAFGSTRRVDTDAEKDEGLKALVRAGTRAVNIVGKSSARQVTQVLETTLPNNLKIIRESVGFLKSRGLTVFYDAEHFFDGFKIDPDYAIDTLLAAQQGGVDCLVLCDTNGGTLPAEVADIVKQVRKKTSKPLGIHAHNDSELAVAVSLAAVENGAQHVEGTINGYGERCGNANLCSIIPALKLKMGYACVTARQLAKLTDASRFVAEVANLAPSSHQPYVGLSAFLHKAGLHVSALSKWEESYQHIDPELVGNSPKVVISELSGKSNIIFKAKELGIPIQPSGKEARRILEQIKELESLGFQYEDADASFELLIHRSQEGYKPPFELVDYMVVVERHRRLPAQGGKVEFLSEATIKVKVDNKIMHTASEGNGPVNALDFALRKGLLEFYPGLSKVDLIDYKVRILEGSSGTGSQVRVFIESSNGKVKWRTVGSSTNIIEASWLALYDSMEYFLLRVNKSARRKK
ncbi:MAG: citramalate synthase [Dehalococcoidia bacterium]|nr:citramalate synthase [Dehalococcoidia bacterium]MDD5494059.1 citramalate synthase [Dehalococcoidia bacterium]